MSQQNKLRPIVLFIRHGESEANRIIHDGGVFTHMNDPNLTTMGHQQAEETAKYLMKRVELIKPHKIIVWVSPFTRTKQTAAPFINLAKDAVVNTTPLLQEYTRTSTPLSEELKRMGCVHHESWSDFISKVDEFDNMLEEEYNKAGTCELFVVFGHSIFISALLSKRANNGKNIGSSNDITFCIPNCSITCMMKSEHDKWNVYTTGSIAHLPVDLNLQASFIFGKCS